MWSLRSASSGLTPPHPDCEASPRPHSPVCHSVRPRRGRGFPTEGAGSRASSIRKRARLVRGGPFGGEADRTNGRNTPAPGPCISRLCPPGDRELGRHLPLHSGQWLAEPPHDGGHHRLAAAASPAPALLRRKCLADSAPPRAGQGLAEHPQPLPARCHRHRGQWNSDIQSPEQPGGDFQGNRRTG